MQNIPSYAIKTIKLQFYIDIMKNVSMNTESVSYANKFSFLIYLFTYVIPVNKYIMNAENVYHLKLRISLKKKKSLNNTSRS